MKSNCVTTAKTLTGKQVNNKQKPTNHSKLIYELLESKVIFWAELKYLVLLPDFNVQ